MGGASVRGDGMHVARVHRDLRANEARAQRTRARTAAAGEAQHAPECGHEPPRTHMSCSQVAVNHVRRDLRSVHPAASSH